MNLLALDTTARRGSITLLRDGELAGTRLLESGAGPGEILFTLIEDLLSSAGLRYADVDAFAAAAGPGSFTGIRVGLAAVKGLAEAFGKPVAAVSTLAALAAGGEGPLRAPVLDGRRGEVFTGLFTAELEAVVAEQAARWEEYLPNVPPEATFIGRDVGMFDPAGVAPLPPDRPRRIVDSLAPAVASLAARRLRQGLAQLPEEVDANYVRRPDAERNWRPPI